MEERKTIYLCLAHMSEDKIEQKYYHLNRRKSLVPRKKSQPSG